MSIIIFHIGCEIGSWNWNIINPQTSKCQTQNVERVLAECRARVKNWSNWGKTARNSKKQIERVKINKNFNTIERSKQKKISEIAEVSQ